MIFKMKWIMTAMMVLALSNLVSATGTLPLNTGYDYSNAGVYANGANDDYWIRIASFQIMTVGDTWAVPGGSPWFGPLPGPTGIPSKWINAFGPTNSGPGVNPGYAIYRKCFCLPGHYGDAKIVGSAIADDTIQIWLNSHLNNILGPIVGQFGGPPHNIAYSNQKAFKTGTNCLYVLVEDAGGWTGLDLAANVVASNATPMIAKGINMSYLPCSCNTGGPVQPTGPISIKNPASLSAEREAGPDDADEIQQIVKIAETRRLERLRSSPPKK